MDVERIKGNPYDNVYWFARILINIDIFGGIGNNINNMYHFSSAIS